MAALNCTFLDDMTYMSDPEERRYFGPGGIAGSP